MRRWLALLAGLLVLLPLSAAHAATRPSRVVVVAVPGLRWEDVDARITPTLWRLARTGAVGALSVKAGPDVSCVADGLLTLTAGARATAYGASCGSEPRDLSAVVTRNRHSRERADVMALGRALRGAGECLATTPGTSCRVVLLEAPTVGGPHRTAERVDRLVAQLTGTVLVVGVSEAPGDRVAHLHVALAQGLGAGALTSASTGRPGFVQLVDVAPTVLDLLGVAVPSVMTGQPWQVHGRAASIAALGDLDRRALAQKAATVPFYVASLAVLAGLLGGLAVVRRRGAVRAVALVGTALPAASFLAGTLPWWRADSPTVALLGWSAVLAPALAAAALPWRRQRLAPVGVVSAVTVLVVGGDLLTGSRLQLSSVTGYSPLVAGRFAGIGNVAFGVYAAAGLLALAWLARGRLWPVAVGGLALALVDGAPGWGSDVGGVLALLPAVVVLALLVTGRRVSVLRLAVAGLAGALLVTGLALLDHARPAARRTHLGRFVDRVADGTAGDVLHRKAAAVLGLLLHSAVTALLPLVVVAAVWLVARPPRVLREAFTDEPAFRHGLVALGVACALGFVLNDSGAAIPALALVVAIPATVAVVSGPRRTEPSG